MNKLHEQPGPARWQRWLYRATIITCILMIMYLLGLNWDIYRQLQTPDTRPTPEEQQKIADHSNNLISNQIDLHRLLPWPKESQQRSIDNAKENQFGIEIVEMPESAWTEWRSELRRQGWEVTPDETKPEQGFVANRANISVKIQSSSIPGLQQKRVIMAMVVQH